MNVVSTLAAAVAAWMSWAAVQQAGHAAREATEVQRPLFALDAPVTENVPDLMRFRPKLTLRNVGMRPAMDVELRAAIDRPAGPLSAELVAATDVPQGTPLQWSDEKLMLAPSEPAVLAVRVQYADAVLAQRFTQDFAWKWTGSGWAAASKTEGDQALFWLKR